jgi:cytoskeletal protein RodZ
MKTVGEILSEARKAKNLTTKALSRLTKIDERYINALEMGDCDQFPPNTFVKGFIRNLSLALNKNPDQMIAIFRRDYQNNCQKPKKRYRFNLDLPLFHRSQLLLIITGAAVFFGYLGFQYRTVLLPPNLEIIQPQEKQVLTSPITVEGLTSTDSTITINDKQKVNPDDSGHFLTNITGDNGQIELKITATNRFGRSTTKTVSLTILSQ